MMEALSPVDVNLCYSEAFQHPSSPNKKAEKFNIHLSMALLLKVLSKCNTCCQSWIEPRIVRKNREMAFRSIIKLCYKCHPSSGMEFMHTYYYPGNSKGSADPLAWKQYNLSFSFPPPPTHSEPSNSKTQMCTIIYEAAALPILWRCCAPCPLTFFFWGQEKRENIFFLFFGGGGKIGGHCMFDMTLPLTVYAKPCSFFSVCLVGLSCWGRQDSGTISDSLVKEPTASYVALQNQNAFARPNCPFIISATKVKCVCSFKDKVAVKWHTVGQYIWAGQMKTFPRFFPEGCSSDVKGC